MYLGIDGVKIKSAEKVDIQLNLSLGDKRGKFEEILIESNVHYYFMIQFIMKNLCVVPNVKINMRIQLALNCISNYQNDIFIIAIAISPLLHRRWRLETIKRP